MTSNEYRKKYFEKNLQENYYLFKIFSKVYTIDHVNKFQRIIQIENLMIYKVY